MNKQSNKIKLFKIKALVMLQEIQKTKDKDYLQFLVMELVKLIEKL